MVKSASVEIINEVCYDDKLKGIDWVLCFQWCNYKYDDGTSELGYRFIWRDREGHLQAARGQARIPNVFVAESLIAKAKAEGWGFENNKVVKHDNK